MRTSPFRRWSLLLTTLALASGCAFEADSSVSTESSLTIQRSVMLTPLRDFRTLDVSGGAITTETDVQIRYHLDNLSSLCGFSPVTPKDVRAELKFLTAPAAARRSWLRRFLRVASSM